MDRGIWATWYDLPVDGRADYLAWLHSVYIPALLQRPGYLWAAHYASIGTGRKVHPLHHTQDPAVPTGNQYILLIGAEHAHVFAAPVPTALHAELPDADQKMLGMRVGTRTNIFAEIARVLGPEANAYREGMTLGPCIQLGSFDCAWQDEEEVLAWYAQWRMAAMETLPGVIRTRKLASVAGWAKHAVIYEWTSPAARQEYFTGHEDRAPAMKAWSARMVPRLIHAPGSSNVACRIWPEPPQ